jgi:glutaredoxin 3
MDKILVYTLDSCPYCERAKQLLTSRNIPFQEIRVEGDDYQTRTELGKRSGMKTFPQIFHGDTVIGGYTDLAEMDERDGLKKLLAG